jgi:hypothetical protein
MACDMELQVGWASLRRTLRSVDVEGQVNSSHEIHLRVRVLPILDDTVMRQLLMQVLRERGWRENPDGSLSKEVGEATATLSADGAEVTLAIQKNTTVVVTARVEAKRDSSESDLKKAARTASAEDLSKKKVIETQRQAEAALKELTTLEPLLRAQLQEALNQVYKRALEQKAAQLGNLESSLEKQEPNGSYEVTVVVRA